MGLDLDYEAPTALDAKIEERADQIARGALYGAVPVADASAEALARFGEGAIPSPEQALAQAEGEIIDELAGADSPEAVQPASEESQAKAAQVMHRVAVVAPRAVSSVNQALALYDNLVEATKPRGFFERLGYGMADRMNAVNKAFMANLNMSPLARKGSGAELKAATSLILQKKRKAAAEASRIHEGDMVTKREDALKRKEGRKLKTVTAEEKRDADEYNRRKKAEGAEWDRRRKVYNKHQRRLVRLRGKVQSEKKKGKRVPSGLSSTITNAGKSISKYVGARDELLLLRSKPAFLAALAAKTEDESVSLFGEEELAWKQAEAQEAIATRFFGEMEALKASVNTIGGPDFSIEFDEVEGVPSLELTNADVEAEADKLIDAIKNPL
jgi:hypothetical protein